MENVLLCATNAGGARNVAPLLKEVKKRGLNPILITSKDMKQFFNFKNLKVIETTSEDTNAANYINQFNPKAIICGATRYPSIDRLLIREGKKNKIKTTVALDEWYNYRIRFENQKEELEFLPDIIACMDEKAKEEAVSEGIPKQLCYVTGSPSLSDLTDKAEDFIKNPRPIPDFLVSSQSEPIFTYLSETFTIDYGSKKGDVGLLGPFLGYTEETVKKDIITILKDINIPCTVVEKLHPSSKLENKETKINENINWIRIKKTDLWSLFWYSNAVIGMRSMALLESKIFNRPTISYQPGLIVKDISTAVKFGFVEKLSEKNELKTWLENQFEKYKKQDKRSINRYPFARKDASENVVNLTI